MLMNYYKFHNDFAIIFNKPAVEFLFNYHYSKRRFNFKKIR